MSEFVYKDYTPANARVIVDYSKKQKVKFSYPIKWTYNKAVWKRAYGTILGFWLSINWVLFKYVFYFLFLPLIIVISIFFPFEVTSQSTTQTFNFLNVFVPVLIRIFFILFYILGIPAIITYFLSLDKDRMSRWIPKLGYFTNKIFGNIKEKDFNYKDIKDNKCCIPIFSNVYLNYKCSGDFNKYLKKVEILEIPFSYVKTKSFIPFLFKRKKEKNDFYFRALFYFTKNPKNGEMMVEFD